MVYMTGVERAGLRDFAQLSAKGTAHVVATLRPVVNSAVRKATDIYSSGVIELDARGLAATVLSDHSARGSEVGVDDLLANVNPWMSRLGYLAIEFPEDLVGRRSLKQLLKFGSSFSVSQFWRTVFAQFPTSSQAEVNRVVGSIARRTGTATVTEVNGRNEIRFSPRAAEVTQASALHILLRTFAQVPGSVDRKMVETALATMEKETPDGFHIPLWNGQAEVVWRNACRKLVSKLLLVLKAKPAEELERYKQSWPGNTEAIRQIVDAALFVLEDQELAAGSRVSLHQGTAALINLVVSRHKQDLASTNGQFDEVIDFSLFDDTVRSAVSKDRLAVFRKGDRSVRYLLAGRNDGEYTPDKEVSLLKKFWARADFMAAGISGAVSR